MKKTKIHVVGKFGTILADPPWEFQNSNQLYYLKKYWKIPSKQIKNSIVLERF